MAQTKFMTLTLAQLDDVYGGAGCNGNDSVTASSSFVNDWHGLGCCHQADTSPGDTAQQRHNFLNNTAGGSGVNPTYGPATV